MENRKNSEAIVIIIAIEGNHTKYKNKICNTTCCMGIPKIFQTRITQPERVKCHANPTRDLYRLPAYHKTDLAGLNITILPVEHARNTEVYQECTSPPQW